MVLSSQSPRPDAARTYMTSAYGRRTRPLWPWLGLILLLLAAFAAYKYLPFARAKSPQAAPSANATAAATPTPTTPPPPPTITFAATPLPKRTPDAPAPAPASPPVAPSLSAAPTTPAAPLASPVATAPPATPQLNLHAAPTDLRQGMSLIEQGQVIEGRALLSRLLTDRGVGLDPRDAEAVREILASVNEQMVFSPTVTPGDPIVETRVIQSGDILVRLAPPYSVTPQLLQRINQVDPQRLFVGQKLKIIKGPFHAVIDKSEFRLDIYLDSPQGRLYIRSFPVGLGREDSTPVGAWIIKAGGKLVNPGWTSPETNEFFPADDPRNPIGERWIGLQGASPTTQNKTGYGIHGTIEPQSIGRQMSLGCIRMRPQDVELVYDLMVEGKSTVDVRQ